MTENRYEVIPENKVVELLQDMPQWSFAKPNITAAYRFASFAQAAAFVTQVFLLAEELDHHPEFSFTHDTVTFFICTHDVGNAVTNIDIETAKRLDAIAQSFRK